MKRIILMSAVLFVAIFSSAQQNNKAKDILDKVSEKTSSFSTIAADFSFSMENKEMEIDEKNEGSIKLKGKKYSLIVPEIGMQVFSNGITLWHYMKDGNQVTVSNIDVESNDLSDPSTIFNIYEKGFDSKFISEKKVGSKTIYQIDLFPGSDQYDVSKITVFINKATLMIQSAILYGTDGNLYGIEVRNMETNKDFPDSDFIFDASKFDDVEIIDFR